LLGMRDRIEGTIREQFVSRWQIIQEEIGLPQDLRSTDLPTRMELDGDRIILTIRVRVPAASRRAEREAQMQFAIPAAAADCDHLALPALLQNEWPLRCSHCGLSHGLGLERCTSPASCWGRLHWRIESPSPKYYVETAGTYGYFRQGPQPRGLRYAIDLSDFSLLGVQYTLRHSDTWIYPTNETLRSIVSRITDSVGTDLIDAVRGQVTVYTNPACLSFSGPTWCPETAPKLPLVVRRTNSFLLNA
jgi:hypothetical protein